MKFAFFKGCFIPVRLPHLEQVGKKVLKDIGLELSEIKGFSCCPEPVGFGLNDRLTWLTLAARNISLAEKEGLDIITFCNGCYYTLKQANYFLKENEELKGKVNSILDNIGHRYSGSIEVKHFAQVLLDDLGLEQVKGRVVSPLKGLSVACHPGCHIISPVNIMAFDDPFDPVTLDKMVSVLGATPLDYDLKTLCCGWTLTNYGTRQSATSILKAKLESMVKSGTDCITVICPQCFHQFDRGQIRVNRNSDPGYRLPVLFYLQLLGLSLGYSLDEIHLNRHLIKDPAFEEKLRRLR